MASLANDCLNSGPVPEDKADYCPFDVSQSDYNLNPQFPGIRYRYVHRYTYNQSYIDTYIQTIGHIRSHQTNALGKKCNENSGLPKFTLLSHALHSDQYLILLCCLTNFTRTKMQGKYWPLCSACNAHG